MSQYLRMPFDDPFLPQVMDLLLEYRLATSVRAYPTLWRLRLLLSSRVWDREKDVALWTNKSGKLLAFAMLWRRRREDTNLILEYCLDPGLVDTTLLDDLLIWSQERGGEIGRELDHDVRLYAGDHSLDSLGSPDFKGLGFKKSKVDHRRRTVFYSRSLGEPIRTGRSPHGFSLMQLDSTSDLDAYDSLYGFTDVDPAFRQELLASDEYRHLVLEDERGEQVSFCEFSISRSEWRRGVERLGWIDYIGTREDQQGQGLGAFVMTAALSELKEMGAKAAMLVTVSDNFPAIGLYEKTGFTRLDDEVPGRYWCEIPA